MGSVIRARAVSPELWWFQFSGDVDVTSAYDTSKYTFAGADQTLLLPLHVFFSDTADSVFVKTSRSRCARASSIRSVPCEN